MNRALFITLGVIIILITVAVWVFLLIKGKPDSTQDVFSDLGIIPEVERPIETIPQEEENTDRLVLSLDDNRLQQLTTNPVAGFKVATSGEAVVVRYVELGTGYIFDINLTSGLQTPVIPNTTANTVGAELSPDLSKVIITTNINENRLVTLLNIPRDEEAEVDKISLPGDSENIAFINDNIARFTRNRPENTAAYTYDVAENNVTTQINLGIPDASVVYAGAEDVYAYPKPTSAFDGALYYIHSGVLEPVSATAKAFVPLIHNRVMAFSQAEGDKLQTTLYPSGPNQDIVMLPEKCTVNEEELLLCGAPSTLPEVNYLEDWYKGKINSDDSIWTIDTVSGSTTETAIPKNLAGRQIDLTGPQVDPTETYLFFKNKIDQTLWLLRL